MNILIPWTPSHWQEIVFSVRSTKRYYTDLDNIFIISEINPKIPGTKHFQIKDKPFIAPLNYLEREAHLNHKAYICALKLGLEEFIFQNDDHYWLKPIGDSFFKKRPQPWLDKLTVEQLKARQKSLVKINPNKFWHWELLLIETLLTLNKNNKPFINYASHMPNYLTIEEMETARDFFGHWGFQRDSGIINLSNRKINNMHTVERLKKGLYSPETDLSDIEEYYFLSHDDLGLTPQLKDFIVSKFYA